ncbi:hypothetical protein M8494_16635 [Serratia ureilytica]
MRAALVNEATFTEHGQKPFAGQAANVKSAALPGRALVSVCLAAAGARQNSRTQAAPMYLGTVDYSVTVDCRLPHSLRHRPLLVLINRLPSWM